MRTPMCSSHRTSPGSSSHSNLPSGACSESSRLSRPMSRRPSRPNSPGFLIPPADKLRTGRDSAVASRSGSHMVSSSVGGVSSGHVSSVCRTAGFRPKGQASVDINVQLVSAVPSTGPSPGASVASTSTPNGGEYCSNQSTRARSQASFPTEVSDWGNAEPHPEPKDNLDELFSDLERLAARDCGTANSEFPKSSGSPLGFTESWDGAMLCTSQTSPSLWEATRIGVLESALRP